MRNLLDPLWPRHFYQPFHTILQRLKAGGYLRAYQALANNRLIGLDGVHYFTSHMLHGPECTVTQRDDQVTYSHSAVLPVLVAPGNPQVISLAPEFITPQDGATKQDCEQNAIQRWVERNAQRCQPFPVTILTDDLHCKQPTCALLLKHAPTRTPLYHNGFGTNHVITDDTFKPIIQAGRARWKDDRGAQWFAEGIRKASAGRHPGIAA